MSKVMFATSIIRGKISITDMESVSLRFWQRENYGSFLEERSKHMERICKSLEMSLPTETAPRLLFLQIMYRFSRSVMLTSHLGSVG